jgi:two-component system sensor histidine kinase UhpB
MLGYSEEELLAESVKDIHPSEEVANDLQRFQAVAENQRLINENRPVLRKDGSIFYADITGRRIVYDERPCVLALFRDVTEQRQAQAALRQSHDELRAIYDQAMDGIIIVDTEKIHPIRVNPAFCRMMGYSAEEAYTLSPERVHSPDVVPAVLEHLETAKRGHVARIDNLPFLLRDGSIVYADVISSPICYDEQPCVISFFHDVTTRTRSDEALRQSYEELRAIYDSMYEGLVILDSATKRIVRVNASLCQMLGYTEEELLSMSITEIYPADEVAATLARLQSRAKGSTEEYGNISILRKDGSVFYADILGNRLSYGGRLCVLGLFRDITEKKQAEVALAESEAKYRTLVETSPDAVIMTDLTGRITFFASQQLAELYGSESVHELLGQHALDYIVPEDHEKFHFHLKRTLEEGVWRNVELTFFRKDGTRYPGEASGALVRDASGKPTALIFVLRDITERKRAEETLQKEHRTLRHLLQSSDHERQLIAYEIHDDLAQQLAAAIMQFQAYAHLKDTNPNDAGKAYDAGMTLLRQGHFEARRLISGVRPPILDESGVVTAIAHLVNEESRVSGPTIAFRSEVEFDRLDPILENAIYRIVQAGLTNACKHSKSERVNVELVQQGDDLRITVQDWGIGFNPREVAEDRFGLEGIRERARLLGGNTVVESTPGQGCCITVALPLVLKE